MSCAVYNLVGHPRYPWAGADGKSHFQPYDGLYVPEKGHAALWQDSEDDRIHVVTVQVTHNTHAAPPGADTRRDAGCSDEAKL